jgi:hypothetical protein
MMILVCGGLADKVTELMCARLEDCGYPYRLLDLAVFPRGYMSLSGQRSIVRRVASEHRQRFDLLKHGPAQFQAQIIGQNIRVHTVGEQLFVTRVRSDSIDYRYSHQDGGQTELEAADLPPAIASACLRLARELDLLVAGIDLMETPDGQYYCFEVNPAPGFLYYERVARQPISAAIAELLLNGQNSQTATQPLVSLREPIPA